MPLRIAITLGLLTLSIPLVLLIAWLTGSELYFFAPTRNVDFLEPPTHYAFFVLLLMIIGGVTAVSRHYGLLCLAILPAGLVLGAVIGPVVREWYAGVFQYLLIGVSLVTLTYGWGKKEYLDF